MTLPKTQQRIVKARQAVDRLRTELFGAEQTLHYLICREVAMLVTPSNQTQDEPWLDQAELFLAALYSFIARLRDRERVMCLCQVDQVYQFLFGTTPRAPTLLDMGYESRQCLDEKVLTTSDRRMLAALAMTVTGLSGSEAQELVAHQAELRRQRDRQVADDMADASRQARNIGHRLDRAAAQAAQQAADAASSTD